jgi:TRAP transporter TAXI family solute receptor
MNWMNGRNMLAIAALASATIFTACKDSGPSGAGTGDGSAAGTGEAGGRRFISIGTAPVGGVFYTIGGAMSDVLDQKGGENWRVAAETTGGSLQNIRLLDAGDVQFAVCNSSISYFAARGEGEDFDKPYPVQAVMTMFPNVAMFVAKKGGGVEKLADLKGKRVAVGPQGAGFEYFIRPLLKAHGVTYDDFTAVYAGQQTCVDYLGDGSIVAAFLGGGVPTASITSAASTMDILLVPFDDAAKETLIKQYPFFDGASIPADTYKGQGGVYEGLNVGSAHFVTHANVAEDLVYEVTKILYENRELVAEKHKAGKSINPKNIVRNTGIDFHPGAVRYYTEIGIWPGSAPKAEQPAAAAAPVPDSAPAAKN